MSDGEDSPLGGVTGERQWYTSVEGHVRGEDEPSPPGSPKANIHVSNEYMDLDQAEIIDEKKALLEEFERKRRARMIQVSTDDTEVKMHLRELGQPICVFGEGPADRRNRLKELLARLGEDAVKRKTEDEAPKKEHPEETWYHEGPPSLKEARMYLVGYSIPRAKARLKRERLEKAVPEATRTAKKQETQNKLRSFGLLGSQNADARPISFCRFSPDGEMLATSSWSGLCKLWKVPECTEVRTLRGHCNYVDCVEFHPSATINMETSSLNLVSSGRDGTVKLWNLESEEPIAELPNMEARVSRVRFHPSGRFLGACVHDNSFRLWDLEIQEEVLFQEGHSKAVFCLAFQDDGSLAVTGGMDAFGRLWDLRMGRCIMFLTGHQNPVVAVDWSPDGYHLATGSEDNSVKIWDVRSRGCVYTIPAHTSIVSGTRYDPISGNYIATSSYDNSVHLWYHGSFQPMKSLEGHGQKVMGVDISPQGSMVVTCSFDRTFKLWGPE